MTGGSSDINLINVIFRGLPFYAGILAGCLFTTACENDLKDVEEISSQKISVQIDRSDSVEVIYSDSAIVKAKLIAPEVLHFKTSAPYYEMPKGILVIFFDENQKETGRTTSDFARRKELEKIVELKNNVVVTNAKGETLRSEEVIWDENQHRIFSEKTVTVTFPNGSIYYGTGFSADESLKYFTLYQMTGNYVPQKEGF